MQLGRERMKKEKAKRKWGKDENYHMLFQQEEPTETAIKTAGKDHYLGAPTTGEQPLPTPITTGASIALYSNNKDWELINTGRGRLVDSTHPKH